jgi:hypothetical protein
MTFEDDLRRWPGDVSEELAFQLIRSFAALDSMLRDIGTDGWSPGLVADELLRRLHRRLQHVAGDYGLSDTRCAAAIVAVAVERIGLDDHWLDDTPAFRR